MARYEASVSADEASDELLMQRIAAGDEAAFRSLSDRHLGRILRLARKMLGSAAEAEDVGQETLLRIWIKAGRWRSDRSRLTTWICTIVYRLAIDRLRARHTVSLDLAMDAEDPAPSALETVARERDLHRLARAMETLQPRQRAALALFYYEELSGPDAAAVMGISLRAFWSLLHRARQTIRQQMQASLTQPHGTMP